MWPQQVLPQHQMVPSQGRELAGDRAGTMECRELGVVMAWEQKDSDISWEAGGARADIVQRRCARSGLGLGNSHCAVKWGEDQEGRRQAHKEADRMTHLRSDGVCVGQLQ